MTVSGVLWLLNFQSSEGYFVESTKVPIHKGMANGNTNITLTAHVLISLEEISPVLQVKKIPIKMIMAKYNPSLLHYLELSYSVKITEHLYHLLSSST